MARVHDFIDLSATCDVIYRHWLDFAGYPSFMEGVEEVRQIDGTRLHWRAEVNGHMEEWDAEIVEEIPPLRLAWRGEGHGATVVCRPTPWGKARLYVEMDEEPLEAVADPRHYQEAAQWRLRADLERLKERVELGETRSDR